MEQTLIRFCYHSSVATFSGTHSQQGYVSREQTLNSFRASWDTLMNIYVDVTDALKKKEITAFDDYMTTKLET